MSLQSEFGTKNTTICGIFEYFQRDLASKIGDAVGWAGSIKENRKPNFYLQVSYLFVSSFFLTAKSDSSVIAGACRGQKPFK